MRVCARAGEKWEFCFKLAPYYWTNRIESALELISQNGIATKRKE